MYSNVFTTLYARLLQPCSNNAAIKYGTIFCLIYSRLGTFSSVRYNIVKLGHHLVASNNLRLFCMTIVHCNTYLQLRRRTTNLSLNYVSGKCRVLWNLLQFSLYVARLIACREKSSRIACSMSSAAESTSQCGYVMWGVMD